MRKVEQCSGWAVELRWHMRRDEMRRAEMRWEELRWEEMKCGVWSVSAKCEVWRVQCEEWSFERDLWNSASLSRKARTHRPGWRTAHASSIIDEKSYSITLRQLPPRLTRVLLALDCIKLFYTIVGFVPSSYHSPGALKRPSVWSRPDPISLDDCWSSPASARVCQQHHPVCSGCQPGSKCLRYPSTRHGVP